MQVTVFNTVGSNEQTVEFNGTTKSELETVLSQNGVTYQGMAMIVGETQVTLDSNQAQTPAGDFTLFLLPKKVKSGYDDDDDFDDDDRDYLSHDDDESSEQYPAETREVIDTLEEAKSSIDLALSIIRTQRVTNPRVLELIKKAKELQQNLGE